MKDLVIIGHGQSMKGSNRGQIIDRYPTVRMKRSRKLMKEFPEDYGTRIDYVASTTAIIHDVISLYPEAKEYWLYIKAKHEGEDHPADNKRTNLYKIGNEKKTSYNICKRALALVGEVLSNKGER